MLASDHEGERGNAAALADRHLKAMRLSWRDLVERAFRPEPAPPPQPPRTDEPRPAFDVRETIRWALCRGQWLTRWEAEFLRSVAAQRTLSPKQTAVVAKIGQRIEQRASGWPE